MNTPLEAGFGEYAAVLRVNVDHADVAQYRAATTTNTPLALALTRRFGAKGTKVRIVRLECIEERVTRGDGGELEACRDEG